MDFLLQQVAWQTVFRDSQAEHAAGNLLSFEYGPPVAPKRQVVSARETCRSSADDRHRRSDGTSWAKGKVETIHAGQTLDPIPLGHKTFQCPYRHRRRVDFSPTAGGLTRRCTNTPADRSKGIRPAGDFI